MLREGKGERRVSAPDPEHCGHVEESRLGWEVLGQEDLLATGSETLSPRA